MRMNALYGATANRYFAYYIPEMAEAITTSGQTSIRWAAEAVNNYMNKILGKDQDNIIYCVDGGTRILVNGRLVSMEELYQTTDAPILYDGIKFSHDCGYMTPSFNVTTQSVEDRKITAVVKRSALKRMYRLWVDEDTYIDLSEDHKIYVKRDGVVIQAIVTELLEDDEFIRLH